MSREISRRIFVKESVLASAGAVLAAEVAAGAAAAATSGAPTSPASPVASPGTWTGKIGNLELSRLMLGGNLITGFAHSRDLDYEGTLMRHYKTPAKIVETLEIAQQHGVNSVNMAAWDDLTPLRGYWEKHGRNIKLIMAANPTPMSDNPFEQIDKAAHVGADAIYMQGVCADALLRRKNMDLMKRAAEHMRGTGRPIGIGAHSLGVIVACEKAKLDVDFYQKTLHTRDYPSHQRPDDKGELGDYDNAWCRNADEVIEFMQGVKKPWIAFKVMAAGAIPPRKAFRHALDGGADFVLAGMFDFQIAADVQIAKEALAGARRTRPWRA